SRAHTDDGSIREGMVPVLLVGPVRGGTAVGRRRRLRGVVAATALIVLSMMLPQAAGGAPVGGKASIRLATVDADSFTGNENAIYAADRNTVFVAYKRFLRDP